jgi:hypothetical protein
VTGQPSISIPFSSGPTLAYIHSENDTATLIDRIPVANDKTRERAICRALLLTALKLLDDSEPTSPVAPAAS